MTFPGFRTSNILTWKHTKHSSSQECETQWCGQNSVQNSHVFMSMFGFCSLCFPFSRWKCEVNRITSRGLWCAVAGSSVGPLPCQLEHKHSVSDWQRRRSVCFVYLQHFVQSTCENALISSEPVGAGWGRGGERIPSVVAGEGDVLKRQDIPRGYETPQQSPERETSEVGWSFESHQAHFQIMAIKVKSKLETPAGRPVNLFQLLQRAARCSFWSHCRSSINDPVRLQNRQHYCTTTLSYFKTTWSEAMVREQLNTF